MIRMVAFATALMALATPALSLSCAPPDVIRSYQRAAEAEEAYIVVHGTLHFDENKIPKANHNDSPPSTRFRARLTGKALSETGFDIDFDREITLDLICFGPWCAGAKSDIPYLGFLKQMATGYALQLDPCDGFGFADPTPEMLRKVEQCHAGGPCAPGGY